jgi:hypothetical protein
MSANQALQRGLEELKTFIEESRKGNPQYRLLDIDQLYSQGFQDMELKPDAILAEETDKITQQWPTCLITALNTPPAPRPAPAPRRVVRRTYTTTNTGGSDLLQGNINTISFGYPSNWAVYSHPSAQLPFLINMAMAPDKTAQIETYHVNAQNTDQAMAFIRMALNRMGENCSYQMTGNQNYGTPANLTRYTGSTYGNGRTLHWLAYLRASPRGVDGIILGTTIQGGNNGILSQVISSIR